MLNLYVADSGNSTIRKIVLATGAVSTLAGTANAIGSADGIGAAARFYTPYGVAADRAGTLYVADSVNHTVRKVVLASAAVTTVAGAVGLPGSTNGTGAAARFHFPSGVVTDGAGSLYIVDTLNTAVRKLVLATAAVSTVAGAAGLPGGSDGIGTAARFDSPYGITTDGVGNMNGDYGSPDLG